jgi:hypothetical protein
MCVAAAFMLCACCHAETAAPCPEAAFKQAQDNTIDNARQQVSDAWTEAENEEIVFAIEKSDPLRWVYDAVRGLVLAKTFDADIHMYAFSRMTISKTGMLFLDGERRSMSAKHTDRLVLFYDKVMSVVKKP